MLNKVRSFIVAGLLRFWKYIVTCRFFCGHLQWVETGKTLGSKLHEHKCLKCGKSIYRDRFNPPVSFVENSRQQIR